MKACSGASERAHKSEIGRVALGLLTDPGLILAPLHERMRRLARDERFEEAAEMRQRAAFLERSLDQHLQALALIDAGELAFESNGRALLIRGGRLVAAIDIMGDEATTLDRLRSSASGPEEEQTWMTMAVKREARVISSWLNRNALEARLLFTSKGWSLPAAARPLNRFAVRASR